MKRFGFYLFVTALFIVGCRNKSAQQESAALAALKSPSRAEQYGFTFWNDQFQLKTDLWQKALAFCTTPDHRFLINCGPVQAVAAPKIPFSSTMPPNSPGGWPPHKSEH